MPLNARTMLTIALVAGCAAMTGCGDKDAGSNSVRMKDMEVVDGTTSDAMTDLDGVQSEGGALPLPSANAAANASAPGKQAAPPVGNSQDTETLSDQ